MAAPPPHQRPPYLEPAKPLPSLDFDLDQPTAEQPTTWYGRAYAWLMRSENVEAHGVGPLLEEQRTDAHYLSNFTIWFTMNLTIAVRPSPLEPSRRRPKPSLTNHHLLLQCFSTGTLGPLYYELSMRVRPTLSLHNIETMRTS